MNIFMIILMILGGIIAIVLIAALFIRKDHFVKREIIINAPRGKVFDYVKLLKNQDNFNKHAMTDADRKREFRGTDGTVGYVYAWSGDRKAGEGEKEIIDLVEGRKVVTEIRFIKPMAATARIVMEMESIADDQTKLTWSNSGRLNYPVNIMVPMMEKMLPKDMDSSLHTLKAILEK